MDYFASCALGHGGYSRTAVQALNGPPRVGWGYSRGRWHEHRHLMSGTPLPEVSAMLGHANVNITLTVYTHFIPKMHTDSSARLADAIFGSKNEVVHLRST